ncbi:hypothetical protein [Marinivivus vitaminiproducens]|nr:hypothetical protein P4R82_15890 [Geminicoccaceae bacterium SCSIO 64248]
MIDQVPVTPEQRRRRRHKNWAIAAMLLAFVLLIYIVTMIKLTGNMS